MHVQTPEATPAVANILSSGSLDDQFDYQSAQIQKIRGQIEQAFKKPPTKASVLSGERIIKQGSKGRRTALFPSRKAGGLIPTESQLELAHAVGNLERTALNYRSQAVRIELPGGQCCYPDFVVLTRAGFYEVHEIKPNTAHLDEGTIRKLKIAEKILNSVGVAFKIIDSSAIPCPKMTDKLLQIYARGHIRYWTANQIALGVNFLGSRPIHLLTDGYKLLQQNDLPHQLLEFVIFHDLVSLPVIKKIIFGEGI